MALFAVTAIVHTSAISRREASEFCGLLTLQGEEGAGKAGCTLHPRSRVRFALTKMHTSIQGSGNTPAFPAQWLYGLYVIALVTGFLATIIAEKR